MVGKLLRHLLLWLLLGFTAVAQATTIGVSVDRNQVQANESFNLIFRSDSDVDDDPDFSPLEKDFDIISRSQSSNIQILNGRMEREITWNLTLIPRRTGQLQIPAIAFGSDRSNPVTVTVIQAKNDTGSLGDDLVYMEASVDEDKVYVQSQVHYTLRIYHAVQLRNASLSELEISDKDAVIEKIEENNRYEKFINGRRYRVFEKRYAIFPQTVGELVIEPANLDAQYIELPRSLRTKRISSDRIKVKVLPVPGQIANKKLSYWLPSKSVTLTEQWSDQQGEVNVGEPITRTLMLQAKGLLASQLPELSDSASVSGLKQYADQPVLENNIVGTDYVGSRQEKIAYIPAEPGQVQLPGVEIFWWDTKTNKMQTASLPSRTINVIAAQATEQMSDKLARSEQSMANDSRETSRPSNVTTETVTVGGVATSVWFWVSLTFMVLWLVTLLLWFKAKRQGSKHLSKRRSEPLKNTSHSAALKQVKVACDGKDPQLAKNALIDWGRTQWPDNPPNSLGHIASRVNGQLATELENLNSVLYKPGRSDWSNAGLWQAINDFMAQQQKQANQKPSAIEPLFRLANVADDSK